MKGERDMYDEWVSRVLMAGERSRCCIVEHVELHG